MKKILLTLAVAALAVVTISGCAKKEEVKEPETTQAVQEAQEGFNVDAPVMQQEAKIETDGEIFPLPVEIDPDNMPDGDWPAQFSSASIVGKDDKRSINCSIYTKDYYDTVEVHNMKVGDLVQVDDEEIEIEDFKNKLSELTSNEDEVHYFGDGAYLIDKESEGAQEAVQVLCLAEKMFAEGKTDTCYSAAPEYLRMAEAERKLQEKKNA